MTGWRRLITLERALLVTLLLIGGALFGFFKLASEVGEGDTMALDRAILLGLRTPANPAVPIGPRWLSEAMTDITAFGSLTGLVVIGLLVLGYLLLSGRGWTALFTLGSCAGGIGVASLLKLVYARPRPTVVPHLVEVASTSFPSGHATDSAIVYLTLAALVARLLPRPGLRLYMLSAAVGLALLIGASRVYLGVHWPSDVAAGWAFGAAWALACSLAYSRTRLASQPG